MVLAVLSCMCEHHPIRCGNFYASCGHYGWGEPYIRMSRCPDCDYCGQRGGAHGIKGLDPRKQDIQKWVDDHEADLAPRKNRCSYAIRDRLSRRFSQALELRRNGTKKHPECGCDFLFEIEVGTIWHEGAKGLEWRFDGDYNPYELAWVINPTELYQDISEQEATCPICDSKLFLMLHEGWIKAPSIGYGNKRRPYRVYYLTCLPDYRKYTKNNPIKSNEWMPPFNRHPLLKSSEWASFWADHPRYS